MGRSPFLLTFSLPLSFLQHVASLSDLEVPACIWGAYALGLRAVEHSPPGPVLAEFAAATASENAGDAAQGRALEASSFDGKTLLQGAPGEVSGNARRETGTHKAPSETALVKLLRRFLGASTNLEGPVLHLLQVRPGVGARLLVWVGQQAKLTVTERQPAGFFRQRCPT